MRKLASVCIVDTVSPIENSDNLEVITLKGKLWRIVTKKGEMTSGDMVVYFEIDSFLPVGNPAFEFLRDRCFKRFSHNDEVIAEGFRIKTIKLRGVVSQGLVLPLNAFPIDVIIPDNVNLLEAGYKFEDGYDLTEKLGIKNYDTIKEEMDVLQGKLCCGRSKGNFPSFITKSDEPRIQNMMFLFTEPIWKDTEFEDTDKDDGSSETIFYAPSFRSEDPFGVCSRNFELKMDDEKSDFVNMAKKLDLQNKLTSYGKEMYIQGELVGPGVNGNKDKYTEKEFHVYRIFNLTENRWYTPSERYQICEHLGLKHVKVNHKNWKVFQELDTFDKMLAYVDAKTEKGNILEGRVFKSIDGNIHFKCINNRYLLKQSEEE